MRQAGRRSAFTLVEVIVALAVILILAAVAVPQLGGFLDQKRIEETAALLDEISDALYGPGSFQDNVGANASQLSFLSAPIVSGHEDSCGDDYSGGERSDWADGGPYVNFVIDPSAGLRTAIGQANNQLTRVTGGGTWLRITWNNTVTLVDAQAMDLYVDGALSGTTGAVRWTPQAGTDMATMTFDVPVSGC
jgi:prepilin-type N-terminal cleavage/methylation domain-containing protein